MPVFSYRGKLPKILQGAMVSLLAIVIGDVEISKGAAVFPRARAQRYSNHLPK